MPKGSKEGVLPNLWRPLFSCCPTNLLSGMALRVSIWLLGGLTQCVLYLGQEERIRSLVQAETVCPGLSTETALSRCEAIRTQLQSANLFGSAPSWRVSPCPFYLSTDQLQFFTELGPHLLSFYRGMNRLYQESVKGAQPTWVAKYLDQGKPEALIQYSRMKRFRDVLPAVIRPDIIPTQDGMVITELDSVPGGIGLSALSRP